MVLAITGCGISINLGGEVAEVGDVEEFSHLIPLDTQKNLDVILNINAAKAVISSTSENIFEGDFIYNVSKLKPEIEYRNGRLKVYQQSNIKLGIQKIRNDWKIKLTDKIPMELSLNINASSTEIDLTDMILNKLQVDLNAGSGDIYISNQNNGSIKNTKLKVNAGDLKIKGLGHLNTEHLDVDVNAGNASLDFRGDMIKNANINIESNAASVSLNVPENVGIKIEKQSGSLKNISGSKKFVSQNGILQTENFDRADVKIIINVKANISSLSID